MMTNKMATATGVVAEVIQCPSSVLVLLVAIDRLRQVTLNIEK